MKKNTLRIITTLIAFGVIAGCSNAPKLTTQVLPQSGFLPNYQILQPVSIKDPDARIWRYKKEGVNASAITGVILEPIYLNQSVTKSLSAEVLAKTKAALQESMYDAISARKDIKIVKEPGPGVVMISVGITDAEQSNDSLQPWNFTPIGLAVNAAAYTTDLNSKTPALVIESKIVDSQSKELLAEALSVIKGESFRTGSGSVDSFVEMAKKAVKLSVQTSARP